MNIKLSILAVSCLFLVTTGCVSTNVLRFSNKTWDVKVQSVGCRLDGVLVTNNGDSIQSFISDVYVTNKNTPNQTFGYYSVSNCLKIAPNETRRCGFYSISSQVLPSNMGGLGCPDISYELR